MKAAYGDPKKRTVSNTVLVWDTQDAAAALDSLTSARRMFFGALLAIAIAVAMTWYWPSAGSVQQVRADNNGAKICGILKQADASMVVITEDGSDKSFPATDLRSMRVVATCP